MTPNFVTDNVIKIANDMASGNFDPSISRMYGDFPLMDTTSNSIISGHHRIIANEITNYGLKIETISSRGLPITPGSWDEIMMINGFKPR